MYDTSDGERFLNVFRTIVKNKGMDDTSLYDEYMVQENDWFDLISFRYYEVSNLWWVVAILNDVTNPFESLEEGTSLKILKNQYLFMVYDSIYEIESL